MTQAERYGLESLDAVGVRTTAIAVFGGVGALLGPLMAQSLFGPGVTVERWLGVMVGAGVTGAAVGWGATSGTRSPFSTGFTTLARSVGIGAAGGALTTLAGCALIAGAGSYVGVQMLFGTIYGAVGGLGLGGLYALWASRARSALEAPSVLARQRLAVETAVVVAIAGALGASLYRVDALMAASFGAVVAGALMILAALGRLTRVRQLLDDAGAGSLSAQPRSADSRAPALVFASPLEKVLVRSGPEVSAEGPFRAHQATEEIAAIPDDLGVARSALRNTVGAALVSLGLTLVLGVGALGMSLTVSCAPAASGSAPCSGCDH